MKKLPNEFKRFCASCKKQNEESLFYNRYFLTDTELDDFAVKHNLANKDGEHISEEIEQACHCKLDFNFEGNNNKLANFPEYEIIFRKKTGPKPKPHNQKVRKSNFCFKPKIANFLDTLPEKSAFLTKVIKKTPEYKNFKTHKKNIP
jgi:hypothetical protein